MIKINLALKKQMAGATGDEEPMPGFLGGLGIRKLDRDSLFTLARELPLKTLFIGILLIVVASVGRDRLETAELAQVEERVDELNTEKAKLSRELAKSKGDLELQKQLAENEKTISTKLDIVQRLISDRQDPPRILSTLSMVIPKNVWVSNIKLDDIGIGLSGQSFDLNSISDFIRNLGETVYFVDAQSGPITNAKDELNVEITNFTLNAKRRKVAGK